MGNPTQINEATEAQEESYNTSEPQEVNKARKKSARTRAVRLEFVAAAMGTEQGRAWFYDLLAKCNVVRTPYLSGDPYGTAFRCGEQNVGLQLMQDIQDSAPDQYIRMVKEARS